MFRLVRLGVALGIGFCLVPVLVLVGVLAGAWALDCRVAPELATLCPSRRERAGLFLDSAIPLAALAPIGWGFAAYIFGGWVLLELAVLAWRGGR